MKQITLEKFLDKWLLDLIVEPVVVKDRIYGKSLKGQAFNPVKHEIMWAQLPA